MVSSNLGNITMICVVIGVSSVFSHGFDTPIIVGHNISNQEKTPVCAMDRKSTSQSYG